MVLESNVKLYQRLGYTITETVRSPARRRLAAVVHDGEAPVKTLIVGDIHGCWSEFQSLLDRAALGTDDQIISIGDMVDRGPESPRVLEFFRDTPNARAIMGNHEMKHIHAAGGETEAPPSRS